MSRPASAAAEDAAVVVGAVEVVDEDEVAPVTLVRAEEEDTAPAAATAEEDLPEEDTPVAAAEAAAATAGKLPRITLAAVEAAGGRSARQLVVGRYQQSTKHQKHHSRLASSLLPLDRLRLHCLTSQHAFFSLFNFHAQAPKTFLITPLLILIAFSSVSSFSLPNLIGRISGLLFPPVPSTCATILALCIFVHFLGPPTFFLIIPHNSHSPYTLHALDVVSVVV